MSGLVLAVVVSVGVWRGLVRRPLPLREPGAARPSAGPVPAGSPRSPRSRSVRHRTLWGRRRRVRSGRDGPADRMELSAAVDLLAVAVTSGLALPTAVAAVGGAGVDRTSRSFASVAAALERGVPFDSAIRGLEADLGADVRPLVVTLAGASESGAPAGPVLQRHAERLRLRHRRDVERRIRQLPVLLIVPLCVFVLPAFVAVTLVPVGWTAARQLDTDLLDRR